MKVITLIRLACAIASGLKPSKLTINTRLILGTGVGVTVGGNVAVAGGREVFGTKVSVGGGASVGVEEEAKGVQPVKINASRIKVRTLFSRLKSFFPNFYRVHFHEFSGRAAQILHTREYPPTPAEGEDQEHRLQLPPCR